MKKYLFLILLPLNLISQSNYNLSLLGTYDGYNSEGTDIWGWVDDITNKEYALVGLNDGVSVVDVSIPANPVEMFYIPGVNSTWRDIKTWGNYAYVTTDDNDPGLLIVDLTDMTGNAFWYRTVFNNPNGTSIEFTNDSNMCHEEMRPSTKSLRESTYRALASSKGGNKNLMPLRGSLIP